MYDPVNPNELISTTGTAVGHASPTEVATSDPLVERNDQRFLVVEPGRDQITSGFRGSVCSVDSDLFLPEGISLSGTHYGLNLISASGVVLIGTDARILPSRKRPSRISGQKVVIAGEAVLERLQGDQLVAFADYSKTVVTELLRGEASLITDKADWILTGYSRKLTKNEPRVAQLYQEAMQEGAYEGGGFDEIRAAQEQGIDDPRSENAAK